MSMIKSNYQIDANDLHPIASLLMDTNNNNIGKMHHTPNMHNSGPSASGGCGGVANSLAPILVATNMSAVQNQNANAISNGTFFFNLNWTLFLCFLLLGVLFSNTKRYS
jgi:hypothetical protein